MDCPNYTIQGNTSDHTKVVLNDTGSLVNGYTVHRFQFCFFFKFQCQVADVQYNAIWLELFDG